VLHIDGSNKTDMSGRFRLSKSRIMAGLQCRKRLWLETHRRELMRVSPASEHIFRMGHLFGECARPLMGQGELVGHVLDIAKAVDKTRVALERASARGTMVYEAAFSYRNVVARADGFAPCADGWHMTEVKAASAIKDYFYQDCAVQVWVAEGAGYPVRKVTLACIDRRFVYPGGGNYGGLLRYIDATEEVARLKAAVGGVVEDLRAVLRGEEPEISVGSHCSSPYACPFMAHCGAQATHRSRVSRRTVHCASVRSPAVLPYPRHFLHIEAIASPVPRWTGTRPYQRIPVLWSCQTETEPGHLIQRAHLDSFNVPSKRQFARTLLDALGSDQGVIVATSVDRACMEALRASVPEYCAELGAFLQRFVHSIDVPVAHGVAGVPEHDDIADSESAEQAWWGAASPETGEDRKQRLVELLLRYARRYALCLQETCNAQGALTAVDSDVSRSGSRGKLPSKAANEAKRGR
jgi:hypothetical protein